MDRESIYAVIRELVPEYKPSDAGKRPSGDRVIMLPTRPRTAVNPS
jgi:hypothetical protein